MENNVIKKMKGATLLSGIVASMIGLASAPVGAEGHGPVFALATPTLGKGQWSSDTSLMSIKTEEGTSYMLREMIGYGIDADLQALVTIPLGRGGDRLMGMPQARAGAMMGSGRDVEASLLWRFDREAPAIGTRRESTLLFSAAVPTEDMRGPVKVSPSTHIGAVTGFASRETYWWFGGGHQYYFEEDQDGLGSVSYLSAAFAWRPPIFQQDYPKPDWRIFIEALAEHAGKNTVDGIEEANSGGDRMLVGPSVLGLFGAWGVSAGVLFPVVQDLNGTQGASEERFRAKAVLTYWF